MTSFTTCLTLKNPPNSGMIYFEEAASSMKLVLREHKEKDILSNRLREWGRGLANSNVLQILNDNPDDFEAIEAEFQELATQKIKELFEKILVSPLDKRISLGQNFVTDPEWPWPRNELDKYYRLTGSNLSPFTGQPIIEQQHTFALEIQELAYKWIQMASSSSSESSSSALALPDEMTPTTEMERAFHIMYYVQLADGAKTIAEAWEETQKHKTALVKIENTIAELETLQEENHQKLQTLLRKQEATIQASIENSNATHQAELNDIKQQIDVLIDERKTLEGRLSTAYDRITAVETQNAIQRDQINSLNQAVNNMRNTKRKKALIPIYL